MDRYDLVALAGLVLLGAGLWWIWPPLGLVVPGGLLIVAGIAGGILRGRQAGR